MKMVRLAWLGTTLGVLLLAPGAEARRAQDDHAALHASVPDTGLVREVKRATTAFVNDGCGSGVTEPDAGGLHAGTNALVKDGVAEPAPDALSYERLNGRLRLLGVEYLVDMAASCEGCRRNPPPPPQSQSQN